MDRAAAIADAAPVSFWLDDPAAPESAAPLVGRVTADLTVIGGGYTGLWSALLAATAQPDRDIVLLDADRCGWAASGRNGGFCAASLTHGFANGLERFGDEIGTLERMGAENLQAIEDAIAGWSIDCDFERTGELSVATQEHEAAALREEADEAARWGRELTWLDTEAMRAEVHSPTYLAGLWDRQGCAIVNPTRLAWGLRRACLESGVRIYEHSPVDSLSEANRSTGGPLTVRTGHGEVRTRQAAVATNAFPSPVRRLRKYIVPVYDYVLMTEPLTAGQLDAIGWSNRQGLGGCGNQFLYYRLTADNRILFGGYDAVYFYGNGLSPSLERRPDTYLTLSRLFADIFPQLEDVRFTHAWSGAIDTCSRFCAFFDRSHHGNVASAAGYTGLGVGASRFGAQVMLDLLAGADTERTRTAFVRSKPLPFPPEPLRYAGIQMTRWSMARADAHAGHRNLWLRTLDRFGMGFDS